jgi:hypothetical protein
MQPRWATVAIVILGFFECLRPEPSKAHEPFSEPAPTPRFHDGSSRNWSGVVLRIEFLFPEERRAALGTGFVIRDHSRQLYVLTCAHLLAQQQWETRFSVRMRTMNGGKQIESLGSSVFVGTAVDLKRPERNGWPDMTHDLVARAVDGSWARPLPLSHEGPHVGEAVWAVGCEWGKPSSDEKLFAGRVVQVSEGGFVFEKKDPFDPRGFSGGPIVNSRGEVIGNILTGGGNLVSGATSAAIRRRLESAGINVD